MKAVVFEKIGGPEVLKIAEVPKPEVKPGTESRPSIGKLVLIP